MHYDSNVLASQFLYRRPLCAFATIVLRSVQASVVPSETTCRACMLAVKNASARGWTDSFDTKETHQDSVPSQTVVGHFLEGHYDTNIKRFGILCNRLQKRWLF